MKGPISRYLAAFAVCTAVCSGLPLGGTAHAQTGGMATEMDGWGGLFDGGVTTLPQDFEPPPPDQVVCGDAFCCINPVGNIPPENPTNCPTDCGYCGDGTCNPQFENRDGSGGKMACPDDCGECGDSICTQRERAQGTCPQDCPVCGDHMCGPGENSQNCVVDCPNCGDGQCTAPNETVQTCPVDCAPTCGNGQCQPDRGETPQNCPQDCSQCGNGQCEAGEENTCPEDCNPNLCGNGQCDNGETDASCPQDCVVCGNNRCQVGENSQNCPTDCATCGDNICSPPVETVQTCVRDCAPCGDGVCSPGEQCPQDCNTCGNGQCDNGETLQSCPRDCAVCGDGQCSTGENCPEDCDPNPCGNGTCDNGETTQTCPRDCTPPPANCPPCGNGLQLSQIIIENQLFCGCCEPGVSFGCHQPSQTCGCQRSCDQNPIACGGCFAPETRVLMADQSEKLISQIKAGDQVWNPIRGRAMTVRTTSFGPEVIPMVQIGYGTVSIEVTDGHPMVVNNKAAEGETHAVAEMFAPASLSDSNRTEVPFGYTVKRADEVKVGDRILGADGKYHTVNVARKLPVKEGQMVYNFKVETDSSHPDDHMVVADGVITGDLWLQEQLKKDRK